MDFLSFVQKGVEKSNKCLAAIAEVDKIFDSINSDLKKYAAGELILDRGVSTRAQIESIAEFVAGVESNYLRNDRILLSLKTSNGLFTEDVAGWKQRATGYPCIIKFDGQELSCNNATHLVTGLSELLSSVGFGNAVNNLIQKASESGAQKKSNVSDSGQSSRLSLVKPAAVATTAKRYTAKPAAKPAAAKAAAKKPVAKPAVKSAAAKAAAKKPAAKSAAKPAVPKVAVKPKSVNAPAAEPIVGKVSREHQSSETDNTSY
ncbi:MULTISPECIES: hypothetical protein [Pseudomonas]|uniref:hypothetical protein n=1 Tax=Pseudomonas TaxID=286 RepID=UPI0015A77605|nr:MULTISPECIES: hypothetical protein [Pseudomonas]